MPVLRFEFVRGEADDPNGFALGDIEVTGNDVRLTSRGHSPSQSMMIYLALVELLLGVTRLCQIGSGAYNFVGTDSSFALAFRLTKTGALTITGNEGAIHASDRRLVLTALRDALDTFLLQNDLPAADPVAEDLLVARKALCSTLAEFSPTNEK